MLPVTSARRSMLTSEKLATIGTNLAGAVATGICKLLLSYCNTEVILHPTNVSLSTVGVIGTLVGILTAELTGGSPPPTTQKPTATATSTSTRSSSSSSSACTLTATPTPIIVLTTRDTNIGQFNDLVKSLPETALPVTFTSNTEGAFWLVALLDQCTSEALWKDSRVQAMCFDSFVVASDGDVGGTSADLDSDEVPTKKRSVEEPEMIVHRGIASNVTDKKAVSRLLTANSHIVEQTNAANNLNWISDFNRQTGVAGPHYDFENFSMIYSLSFAQYPI